MLRDLESNLIFLGYGPSAIPHRPPVMWSLAVIRRSLRLRVVGPLKEGIATSDVPSDITVWRIDPVVI